MAILIQRQLPQRLPNILAGDLEFEAGYSLDSLISKVDPVELKCSICQGIPKEPIELNACGHLYCKACIYHHTAINGKMTPVNGMFVKEDRCPLCRKAFYPQTGIRQFKDFQPTLSRLYKSLEIRCGNECGFISDPFSMDEHLMYDCCERVVRCPNYKCPIILKFQELEAHHFPQCPRFRYHCPKCLLLIELKEPDTHDCFERQKKALTVLNHIYTLNSYKLNPICLQGEAGKGFFKDIKVNRMGFTTLATYGSDILDMTEDEDEEIMYPASSTPISQVEAAPPNGYDVIDNLQTLNNP